jgi:hypothetical protein
MSICCGSGGSGGGSISVVCCATNLTVCVAGYLRVLINGFEDADEVPVAALAVLEVIVRVLGDVVDVMVTSGIEVAVEVSGAVHTEHKEEAGRHKHGSQFLW